MSASTAVRVFFCFAFAYFFAALVRGVTATLAPDFSAELGLDASDLGLLAGAYFFGFAIAQLPLGGALDRHGPRRVLLLLLVVAVMGCIAFGLARSFAVLTLARALIGVGLSACLMAPMTTYRHHFRPAAQMRANSWMLMTGSMGMVASTLPVQWLLPLWGWRGLFWVLAAMFALAASAIFLWVPRDGRGTKPGSTLPELPADVLALHPPTSGSGGLAARMALTGYGEVFRHPTFRRFLPMGFFHYGGMIAIQSLWAGPWLSNVTGLTTTGSAWGLFVINLGMLSAFLAWGLLTPSLYRRGWTAQRLVARGAPLSVVAIGACSLAGPAAGAMAWALFCVSSTVVSLSQPAIGQAFPATLAGRALSAYNLVIFFGVFMIQWGMGVVIDVGQALGASVIGSYQWAIGLLTLLCAASYAWFIWGGRRDEMNLPKEFRPTADI